ncbi:MAG TPA: hypothetical protein VEP89_01940 [Draconibacterium sp.]|nr:hypothetical protein [Draconibacterium sp.]
MFVQLVEENFAERSFPQVKPAQKAYSLYHEMMKAIAVNFDDFVGKTVTK